MKDTMMEMNNVVVAGEISHKPLNIKKPTNISDLLVQNHIIQDTNRIIKTENTTIYRNDPDNPFIMHVRKSN